MKIGGIDPKLLPPEEILVLPRVGGNLVFKARGLSDMDEFDKLCPEPIAPMILTKDGKKLDANNKSYRDQMLAHGARRMAYIVVKSLEPTTVEWDTVKPDDPSTWANWRTDLAANGLTSVERNRIFNLVLEANSLDEKKLEKARESFIAGPPQGPEN